MKRNLTLAELNDTVVYDDTKSKTFVLLWKTRADDNSGFNMQYAGTPAGCKTEQGYVHLSIRNHVYKLHRLVYMMKHNIQDYNSLPRIIDHQDRDNTNNVMENLRDGSTDTRNSCLNSRNRKNLGVSKYIGVSTSDKLRNKFQAWITVNYYDVPLANYADEITCAMYYKAACKYLNYEVDECYAGVEDIELPNQVILKLKETKKLPPKEMKESSYAGVTWARQKAKFIAKIHTYVGNKSKSIHVGYYASDKEAAICRDLAIIEKGLTNELSIVSKKTYTEYRELYPKPTRDFIKVKMLGEEEFPIFTSLVTYENTLHKLRKPLSAYLKGKGTLPKGVLSAEKVTVLKEDYLGVNGEVTLLEKIYIC